MAPRHRRVAWSDGAYLDLDEAVEYVAEKSRQNAISLLERLLEAGKSLDELPERGRMVPELGDPAIRELLIDPYRLIYAVGEAEVTILGILHHRRDFGRWERV